MNDEAEIRRTLSWLLGWLHLPRLPAPNAIGALPQLCISLYIQVECTVSRKWTWSLIKNLSSRYCRSRYQVALKTRDLGATMISLKSPALLQLYWPAWSYLLVFHHCLLELLIYCRARSSLCWQLDQMWVDRWPLALGPLLEAWVLKSCLIPNRLRTWTS